MLNNRSTFFAARDIPQDIFNYLAQFIFPETPEGDNEFLKHAFSNQEIKTRYQQRFDAITNKFFLHIIHGEKSEAEAMIQKAPAILLLTGTVTDYSRRAIEGSALGMALGAEDVKCHDTDDEGMVEMLHRYLRQLPNGEAIIAEQTAKQFPESWELEESKRQARDRVALNAVFDVITNPAGKNDVECEQAMEFAILSFRKYLSDENSPDKIIKAGIHFNHELLAEAFDLYNQHYDHFGGFDSAKNNTVWCKVIGSIERYVPAATAQAFSTGLGTIVDSHGKLKRTLSLQNHHTSRELSYFPFDPHSISILGWNIAVCGYNCGRAWRRGPALQGPRGSRVFTRFKSNKNIQRTSFIKRYTEQSQCHLDPEPSDGCVLY